jgi:hypothetical protein
MWPSDSKGFEGLQLFEEQKIFTAEDAEGTKVNSIRRVPRLARDFGSERRRPLALQLTASSECEKACCRF